MNAGIFIQSTSLLDDTIFDSSLIFITEYNGNGAMGFVVNKLFPRQLTELEEFRNGVPFPLYEGGPVDQEHLFFIHQRPDLIEGGTLITDDIFYGGNFQSVIKYINLGMLTEKDVKIFIGYCGWDHTELDDEIAEGSWQLQQTGDLFNIR